MKKKAIFITLIAILSVAVCSGQKSNKKFQISGRVTDMNQIPVAGITIFIDNLKTDKSTDKKGYYKIKVKPASKKISVFSLSGKVAESTIEGRTKIDLSLPVDITAEIRPQVDKSGEEEVNIGYGNVKRKDLLNPVGKVDGTNKKYAAYQNIYDMLREQPGIQVTGTSVKIQGSSSFMLSTEPLYVVDGNSVNSIEGISPQMVKSIEVLKGPAASIYGSRGANGVILITLINGK